MLKVWPTPAPTPFIARTRQPTRLPRSPSASPTTSGEATTASDANIHPPTSTIEPLSGGDTDGSSNTAGSASSSDASCFSAHGQVRIIDGSVKYLADLEVGDMIQTLRCVM